METLSVKITLFALANGRMVELYREKDVKEFIKKCRKQIMLKGRRFNIDELAGKELANG